MEYIKLFDTENEYKTYRDGEGYIKPNVSLTIDTKNVYYNLNNNEHPYVDLDLPSGTLWAKCNVGASKPTDYGLYFQWGDTSGYTADQVGKDKYFDWNDYKWNPSGDGETFTKYTKLGDNLELEDDAANANMGGDWHMPTDVQFKELLDNTTSSWTTQDDVKGRRFTSKNDNTKSIFIPAAGNTWRNSFYDVGGYGRIWTSVLSTNTIRYGQYLYFNNGNITLGDYVASRIGGRSVRGVIG